MIFSLAKFLSLPSYDGPDPSGGRHLGLRWFAERGRWRRRWRGVLAGALKTKPLHVMNSY